MLISLLSTFPGTGIVSNHPPDNPALTLRISTTLTLVERPTVLPKLSMHLLVGTENPAVPSELCLEERAHTTLPEAACPCTQLLVDDRVSRAEQDPRLMFSGHGSA